MFDGNHVREEESRRFWGQGGSRGSHRLDRVRHEETCREGGNLRRLCKK
jgi:hypothetical protein